MKNIKYLVLAVLLIINLGFVSNVHADPADATTSSACISLSSNLKYRSTDAKTNGDVSTLQDFLQTGGYLSVDPTGYFNLTTKKAVRSFQLANGLTSDGSVGPITRAKLNATYGCGGTTLPPVPAPNPNLNAAASCSPGTYVACTSNANACGQTAGGYKLCGTNTCGVAVPSDLLCPGSTGSSLKLLTPNSGTFKDIDPQLLVSWTPYAGDFDHYNVFLGNNYFNGDGVTLTPSTNVNKNATSLNVSLLSATREILANSTRNDIKNWYFITIKAYSKSNSILATSAGGLFTIKPTSTSQACTITDFTATPSTITTGQSSKITYSTLGCTSVSLYTDLSSYIPTNSSVSGDTTVSPTSTKTYFISASNAFSTVATKSITITVNPTTSTACTVTNLTASPSIITLGQSITLTWNTNNCTYVGLYEESTLIVSAGQGSNLLSGSVSKSPTSTTTYTLSTINNGIFPTGDVPRVVVIVNPASSVTSAPLITGLQGVSTTGVYTNWSGVAGQSVAIYGTFATSGNTVKIGDDTYTPTYQSATQLNVLLSSTLSTGQKKVTVTNANGTSNSPSINIVSTIPVVSATPMPVVTGIQGYPGYTTGTAVAGQYVVLYGTFTTTGNTVTIGNQAYTPTYQGTTQINVNIGSALGPLSVSVTNPNGTSNSVVVTVASASTTTPPPANTGGSSASVTCPSGTPVGTAIPCTSTANSSCGKTNAGYVQCGIPNVSCSATTPIENLCTAPATSGNHWACVTNAAFGIKSTMCQDASGNAAAYNSCGTPINACQ
jgi:hypothetical protein